jgi:hypothetical protein
VNGTEYRVWVRGAEYSAQGTVCRVQARYRIWDAECSVQSTGYGVASIGQQEPEVQEFRVQGCRLRGFRAAGDRVQRTQYKLSGCRDREPTLHTHHLCLLSISGDRL